jgi:hypothetical protein
LGAPLLSRPAQTGQMLFAPIFSCLVFGKECSNPIHRAVPFTLVKYSADLFCPGSLFKHCHYCGSIIPGKREKGFESTVTTFERANEQFSFF